jgi:hypothetical protein
MANTILTSVGNPIRLNLQISDGEESLPLIVKAFIKDDEGQLLLNDPIELFHVGLGLFKNYSLEMPDLPEVTAQYVVYENDGITPAPYLIDMDIFAKFEPTVIQDVNVEALISRLTTETMDIAMDEEDSMLVEISDQS